MLSSLDYNAIEVLSAAVFAGDRNLLEACATGDPHAAAAQLTLWGRYDQERWLAYSKEDPSGAKKNRQDAKIVNFGLLFGGGAGGLVTQARDLFDTVISEDEARERIASYYRFFPGLKGSRNQAYRAMDRGGPIIEVRNSVGFRRFLEKLNRKPTSWLNTRIQSDAGYGLKSSFRYLREAGLLPFLIAQVHDELLFEFPEELSDADQLPALAQSCMIQGMRDVLGANLPIKVEIDTGRTWS